MVYVVCYDIILVDDTRKGITSKIEKWRETFKSKRN